MLSAIAARKAAQAASAHATPVLEPEPPAPTPVAVETPPSHSRSNSKRKPTSQVPNSSRKRKKKREAELKKSRYFEAGSDPSQHPDDIIIIDSDEDEEGDVSYAPPALSTRTKVVGKRGWSPSAPIHDSSDEEVEEILDVPIQASATKAPAHLTTFQVIPDKTAFFIQSEEAAPLGLSTVTATVTLLTPGQTISLLGVYTFAVLQGVVSVSGVHVPASPTVHRVFAPRSAPIPTLEALDGKASHLSVSDVPLRLRPAFQSGGAIVALQQLQSGVEGLGRICRTFDGVFQPSRWQQRNDAEHDLRLPGVHLLTEASRDIQPFILPTTWETALQSLSDSVTGVYLVKGHKKSGKSSFARTLLNRLLTRYSRVAFLECDVGQSEFTPGGLVALNVIESPVFGPPFTHPTIPNFAHYVGAATPRSSPSHYLASIRSLMESYQLDMQATADVADSGDSRISDTIPLVVNTMGWTKGLGADLARKIEDIVQPTDIFEVEAPAYEYASTIDPPLRPLPINADTTKLHLLQPIAPSVLSANYSATDHRAMSLLSYFHAIFPRSVPGELQQATALTWNTALPLCAYPPYEVDWSVAFEKIILCGAGAEDVVPSEIDRILNGALVGLVTCEPGSLDTDVDMAQPVAGPDADAGVAPIPYTQGAEAPSPSTSKCHGLALVRAISPSSPHMHVLTPLPPHLFTKSSVLVKGEMELPVWGMLDFRSENDEVAGVEKAKVPYLQWGKGEGLGGERRRIRRNLMRKGQM
ncbi:hypothetical protein B0H10DRAFT_1801363 [Mycena sp. CBHHK59/15]|nr:hypothetical protein B0H10DRAFT_1801363 [Mycena sp. CBHHK59/15]